MRRLLDVFRSQTPLSGGLYALVAFGMWGGFPAFYKMVADVPAFEVLAHRILWSVAFVAILLFLFRRWGRVYAAISNRKCLGALAASGTLNTINWGAFIWAVTEGHVLQTSLGYYITPLVSVSLGVIFLGERLTRPQWLAVALAALGVGVMAVEVGVVPWIALTLAFSFGCYGLIRKMTPVDALSGLFIETLLVSPFALGYLVYLGMTGDLAFHPASDPGQAFLLSMSGVITALPLIFFAQAAKRIRLSSLGLFQYIAPTGHFLLAILAYGEVFTLAHGVTFGLIWLALAAYSADTYRRHRAAQPA